MNHEVMSMKRACQCFCPLLFLLGVFPSLPVQAEKPPDEWLLDAAVTILPRSAPLPALKYRFFPLASLRKEGNAVPIYLRFAHERNDATKRTLQHKTEQWNALPLEKLPLKE